jgi:integrase
MGIWQIKGKGWRYQFQYQGKQYSGQWFPTKTTARDERAEHRKRLKTQPTSESGPPAWDIDSLNLEYLEEAKRKFRTKTWKYKRFVYQSFQAFCGNLFLSQITPHLVGKYLLTRPSNYNYNFHRKDLSALFRWAVSRGLMAANPCAQVVTMPEDLPVVIHLTPEEWSRFLLAAGPERPFFLTVFYTLGRVGEIFRLRWADLDWEREEIRLFTRKRQSGELEEDWLPLAPELKEALRGLARRPAHPEYIFINPRTGQPYTQRRKLLRTTCRRAGIREFGFHAIRHLGADWLMNHGEDLRTISRYLRHKSLATTEKYLRRRPDESLRRAARTLQNKEPLTDPLTEPGRNNGSKT